MSLFIFSKKEIWRNCEVMRHKAWGDWLVDWSKPIKKSIRNLVDWLEDENKFWLESFKDLRIFSEIKSYLSKFSDSFVIDLIYTNKQPTTQWAKSRIPLKWAQPKWPDMKLGARRRKQRLLCSSTTRWRRPELRKPSARLRRPSFSKLSARWRKRRWLTESWRWFRPNTRWTKSETW